VGLAEAAEILNWSKSQLNTYMRRGKFPEPIQRLTATPVWTREQIEEYKKSRENK
jgi:predicted DNA-binding transcriptional regulator AlpA